MHFIILLKSACHTYCRVLCKPHGYHLTLITLHLGPSMAINISHQCLVRFWTFTGTCRFLAGLFTFLTWVGSLLSTGSELVEVTIIMTMRRRRKSMFFALSLTTLCSATKCGWSCMQMNGETDNAAENWHRSELPMTSFDVTHPGLAAVKSWYI